MTSKNLFCNLMKENTKRRLWTISIIALIFFFLFPVWTALRVSSHLNLDTIAYRYDDIELGLLEAKTALVEEFINWITLQNGFLIFLIIVFAILCGASGYAYLHDKKKTDFFHSIPVKRELLFSAIYLNGVLYTAVPYLINLVLAALLLQVKSGVPLPWGTIFSSFVIHMVFFLLLYSVVIVAVILTGNTIVGLLGVSVFFLWGPGVLTLIYSYYSSYYKTFFRENDVFVEALKKSSPAAWYISAAESLDKATGMAFCALGAAILLTGLSIFLYKKRPSEAAGKAMAFKKSQPIIKILLVVPIALFGSILFYTIKESDGWGIFGLLCGLLISYAVVEIIYNFDFRQLFSHKRELALCFVVSTGILAFFRFDLSGYDTYLPSAGKIASSSVYCNWLDTDTISDYYTKINIKKDSRRDRHYINYNYGTVEALLHTMKLGSPDEVLEIAKQGISDTQDYARIYRGSSRYIDRADSMFVENVTVQYQLTNGKRVYRQYVVNMVKVEQALSRLYNNKEYKDAAYPILLLDDEEVSGVNYQEYGEFEQLDAFEGDAGKELLQTYKEELYGLTTDTRRKENPIAALQFKNKDMQEMIDIIRAEKGDYTQFNRFYYYPVYPSFTRTISLLEKQGIHPGNFLTSQKIDRIELSDYARNEKFEPQAEYAYTSRDDVSTGLINVTDKRLIGEIIKASSSRDLSCTNRLNEASDLINATAFVTIVEKNTKTYGEEAASEVSDSVGERISTKTYSLYLDVDKLPKQAIKDLGLE